MIGLLCFVLAVLGAPFKSKLRLEAENAVLRHQLIVLRRRLHGRVRLTDQDRWFLIRLYRWFPSILQALTIIRPETLVRWDRAGFRAASGACSPTIRNPLEPLSIGHATLSISTICAFTIYDMKAQANQKHLAAAIR